MDIQDGTIHSESSTLTSYTYPTSGKEVKFISKNNVESILPKEPPIAKCLLIPSEGLISTIVCNFKDADGIQKKYTVYKRDEKNHIALEKGKITTINLLYLPKDIKISAKIEMWDSLITYDMTFKESEITN